MKSLKNPRKGWTHDSQEEGICSRGRVHTWVLNPANLLGSGLGFWNFYIIILNIRVFFTVGFGIFSFFFGSGQSGPGSAALVNTHCWLWLFTKCFHI